MLTRILEPEIMDSADDAREYDAMDHSAVNAQFVTDLLAITELDCATLQILDLGAGTAQIPIELARRAPHVHITAVDAAASMLAVARANIAAANLTDRIEPILADAKQLPFADNSFAVVISNSILHHIADPQQSSPKPSASPRPAACYSTATWPDHPTKPNCNISSKRTRATPHPTSANSSTIRCAAALTLEEIRDLVASLDFARDTVQMTSDRHWTWSATRM